MSAQGRHQLNSRSKCEGPLLLTPSIWARGRRRSAMGHEDAFPRSRLSARYRFSQGTFAGTRDNGRGAPIPALAGGAVQLPGSIPLQAHTEVFLAGRANRKLGEATLPGA